MVLTTGDVYVDQALSNVSIKYTNDTFIADMMLPILKVAKMTGKYYVYDKANLRVDKTQRALGSPANEIDFGVDPTGTYSCNDHALKGFIPDQIQDQADAALNPLVDEVEAITEKLLLDRETNAANLLTSTGTMTQNVTLTGTAQWSDYTNSDPIGDVRTARTTIHQNTFKKPNVLLLGKQVFDILIEHPAIIERIKYSQLGVVSAELLARVFQVDKILVGEAGSNTAKEGQTDSLSYIWGKNAVVAYVSPQIRLKMVSLGVTFTYGVRSAKRWRDEDREGTYVRIGNDNYIQVVLVANCGYLIATATA
jgi:major capsid protein E